MNILLSRFLKHCLPDSSQIEEGIQVVPTGGIFQLGASPKISIVSGKGREQLKQMKLTLEGINRSIADIENSHKETK